MDHSSDTQELQAIRRTLIETPGVNRVLDIGTRVIGGMVVVDARISIDAPNTAEAGVEIAIMARQRVLRRHPVLNVLIDVEPR